MLSSTGANISSVVASSLICLFCTPWYGNVSTYTRLGSPAHRHAHHNGSNAMDPTLLISTAARHVLCTFQAFLPWVLPHPTHSEPLSGFLCWNTMGARASLRCVFMRVCLDSLCCGLQSVSASACVLADTFSDTTPL